MMKKGSQTVTETVTLHPSSYISKDVDGAWYSLSNASNAYASTSSTSYASIGLSRGNNAETYIYFTFDTSSIPANATIDSIACMAKVYISNGSATAVPTKNFQLFSGTTAKGTAYSNFTNSAKTITLDVGTWTRSELSDTRIRFYAQRGTSSTSTSILARLYGADLTITYSYTT